ncbi:hypothetical protein [Nostoc sp. NIES-3756]|uniref:hypothetical protein n=1 Tax=Nostoc sp. NIES-3756 TaxID=1751286 RepID=UPI000B10D7AF|nr:hypothetical protein [Nostoc sp. NIES-3756]
MRSPDLFIQSDISTPDGVEKLLRKCSPLSAGHPDQYFWWFFCTKWWRTCPD